MRRCREAQVGCLKQHRVQNKQGKNTLGELASDRWQLSKEEAREVARRVVLEPVRVVRNELDGRLLQCVV